MEKKRSANLDILRSLAAIAVAMYHILANSVHSDPSVAANLVSGTEAFCAALYWHVPVFYMITGYLWLSDSKECTYGTVKNNVRRFILVLFTIGYAYAMMELVFSARTLTPALLAQGFMNVIKGNLWDHMWYVYAIIGIYLFLPVLKPFFVHSKLQTIVSFVGLLFVLSMLAPAVSGHFGFAFPVSLPVSASLFYVCVGGLLSKLSTERLKKYILPAGLLFICSTSAAYIHELAVPDNSWTALFNCLCALGIFLVVLPAFSNKESTPWLREFANCSFGIYLFHQFFINIMFKVLHLYPFRFTAMISIPLAGIVIIGLSFATTYILRKIKPIKKYLL